MGEISDHIIGKMQDGKYHSSCRKKKTMTLADLKAVHTGNYELIDAKLIRAGNPIMTWQNLTITDGSGDYEMSTPYDVNMPDLEVRQDDVGKVWQFRVKAMLNGNFINLRGHIHGPSRKEQENAND